MEAETGKPSRKAVYETLAASLLILVRLFFLPPPAIWKDWVLVLAAYWIFTAWGSKSRAWSPVTLGVIVVLVGIWTQGQIRPVLELWGVLE